MNSVRKLRIGVLQDSVNASLYVRDLIAWAQQQDDLEVSNLIVYALPEEGRLRSWRRILSQHKLEILRLVVFRCIQKLEQRLLKSYYGGKHRYHSRQFPVDSMVGQTVHIRPTVS